MAGEMKSENRQCCQCRDDEAHKYGECFCRCHTRVQQRPAPRYHEVVRHDDGTQFVPTDSGYIQVDPAVRDLLASECSVPAPYCGNAMDPVNDLRLVSGRRLERVRAALGSPEEPACDCPEVCKVCGGRAKACALLGHRPEADRSVKWHECPRAQVKATALPPGSCTNCRDTGFIQADGRTKNCPVCNR